MSITTATLFDNKEYADVMVQFSGQEIACHKFVLCPRSEYFYKLCGPGSQSAGSGKQTVELKDDDPDAVEAMLKFLYTDQYTATYDSDWRKHLEVSKVADKYLVPTLASQAWARFVSLAMKITKIEAVFETMVHIRKVSTDPRALAVADSLEQRDRTELLQLPAYRRTLENDTELLWRQLDELCRFKANLVPLKLLKCPIHLEATKIVGGETPAGSCPRAGYNYCKGILDVTEGFMSQELKEALSFAIRD